MPYDTNPGATPEASGMEPGSDMDTGAEAISASEDSTATLPVSVTGGKTFKQGDEIVLQVVDVMEDGGLVVKYASEPSHEDKGESYDDYLRREMSPREPREEAM